MRKKIKNIIKIVLFLGFIGFSIYVSCLDKYSDFNWFTRMFSCPFAEILLFFSKICGNSLSLGMIFSILFYFLTYGMLANGINKKIERLVEHQPEMNEIKKIEDQKERSEKIIEFMERTKIDPFCSFYTFLLLPFQIMAFRGILNIPYSSELFNPNINTDLFWVDLLTFDKLLILPMIYVLLTVLTLLLSNFTKKKEDKNEESPISKYMKYFSLFAFFLILGCCFRNALLNYYLIISALLNLIVKTIELVHAKKGEKNGKNSFIKRIESKSN